MAAAMGEPEAAGMTTWYGLNLLSIACTASCTAAWTIAKSMIPTRRGRPAVIEVAYACAVRSFQSTTASARAKLAPLRIVDATRATAARVARRRRQVFQYRDNI